MLPIYFNDLFAWKSCYAILLSNCVGRSLPVGTSNFEVGLKKVVV